MLRYNRLQGFPQLIQVCVCPYLVYASAGAKLVSMQVAAATVEAQVDVVAVAVS